MYSCLHYIYPHSEKQSNNFYILELECMHFLCEYIMQCMYLWCLEWLKWLYWLPIQFKHIMYIHLNNWSITFKKTYSGVFTMGCKDDLFVCLVCVEWPTSVNCNVSWVKSLQAVWMLTRNKARAHGLKMSPSCSSTNFTHLMEKRALFI